LAGFEVSTTFLAAFVAVVVFTPLVRKYALRWKLGDKPNGRKIHTANIPHIGGIAIVLGTLLGLFAARVFAVAGAESLSARVLLPVALIVGLGLTDDIKNLKARRKLTVQIIASLALAMLGVRLYIGVPVFDGSLILVGALSAFYLVGMSSSVNLIDGHDGLAAGTSLISAVAFAVIAGATNAQWLMVLSLSVAGACLGFLIYNFPPGRIFMGDTGSMFLGIMLGIVACYFTMMQLDSCLAIVRRLSLRRPVFQADCLHIHHILTSFGFSTRETLFILYGMQAVMAFLGILVMRGFTVPLVLGLIILTLAFYTFIRIMVAAGSGEQQAAAPKFSPGSVPSLEK
jgi:UDP-GlcNAc:undecaprenyl-phosphate GlcNAc-1-phosphate transferase